MTQVVRAIYDGGVLKPLEPLELSDKQVVELSIKFSPGQRNIVRLGGSWSAFFTAEPSREEIETLTHEVHEESLKRLLDQLDGMFDDESNS